MGKFSRNSGKRGAFSEINVTPMVDVMMVLLVIFMVTAPMLTTGVSLDLPHGDGQAIEDADKAIDISVDAEQNIWIGDEKIQPDRLVKKVKAMQRSNKELKIIISGDRAASYGQVIELMSLLRLAGISKVGLKTGDILDTQSKDLKDKK
ncbi:MAG: biopolymer transporter ExbD [Alphaproteobacteria bacterium]|nr:biopolymer transporter ExbD [Alphaproteobacteria bacterium]